MKLLVQKDIQIEVYLYFTLYSKTAI